MRYRLQRHDGTDCSATMVPITVLRMVPIQRYRQHTFKEMYGSVTTSWTEAVYAYDIIVLENETNGEYNLTAKWIDVAGDDWQETTY